MLLYVQNTIQTDMKWETDLNKTKNKLLTKQ